MPYPQTLIFATTKVVEMLETILISVLIVAICVALMAVSIICKKDGRFPNTHVSGSKALRQKGIGCVQAQDREAQLKQPMVKERER